MVQTLWFKTLKINEEQCYIKTILDMMQTREVGVEFHDTWIDVNQNSDWMIL